jgi:RimJ/RimL family protein N-acetyltransferase
MREYSALHKQTFTKGEFALVPLRAEDRFDIMKWRNEQIYHLRQAKPLTLADQDNYFENVVAKLFNQEQPNQILFSFLQNGVCIGYGGLVHINWVDQNAEVSFIMNTELEAKFFAENWRVYLGLIEEVAFKDLQLHKIYTYAFDLRPHLYPVLESNGFLREADLADHCFFEGEFKKVVIHAKLNAKSNAKIGFRKATQGDAELIFTWSNDPLVRAQSFKTEPIVWQNHLNWFGRKLSSSDDMLLIVTVDEVPAGFVRFENIAEKCTIGILIAADFRGLGLAANVISKATDVFFKAHNKSVHAYIKASNVASKKSFEKAGYAVEKSSDVCGVASVEYVKDPNR